MTYPWYEQVINSNQILQGDFIPNCPIVLPPATLNNENGSIVQNVVTTAKLLTVIIMSQSCDLDNNKVELVLVCPVNTLDNFLSAVPGYEQPLKKGHKEKVVKALKDGHYHGYHLLNNDEGKGINYFPIIDFKNVYSVDFNYLKEHALRLGNRTRLLPPYREHLSQAFARYFMRVGLPTDINVS